MIINGSNRYGTSTGLEICTITWCLTSQAIHDKSMWTTVILTWEKSTKNTNINFEQAQVWGAKYFRDNFNRLAMIKSKVDAENFFRHEQSIPLLLSSWYHQNYICKWKRILHLALENSVKLKEIYNDSSVFQKMFWL